MSGPRLAMIIGVVLIVAAAGLALWGRAEEARVNELADLRDSMIVSQQMENITREMLGQRPLPVRRAPRADLGWAYMVAGVGGVCGFFAFIAGLVAGPRAANMGPNAPKP